MKSKLTHSGVDLKAVMDQSVYVRSSIVSFAGEGARGAVPCALGMGAFLFRPMALGVAFAMIAAYVLSRSFVPALCSLWLRGHAPVTSPHSADMHSITEHHDETLPHAELGGLFARWEALIERAIR